MRNDSAPPSPDQTAQETLRDLIDGKLRGAPSGPESLGDILTKRVVPVLAACCVEPHESSEKIKPR